MSKKLTLKELRKRVINNDNYKEKDQWMLKYEYDLRDDEILIYPNPSSGILNLKSITEIEQYSIFNISGKLLLRKLVNLKEITLELTNLENGTYFLNFTTNNSLVTKKIIVIK